MLKVTILETILRGIPEIFLMVWATYLFTQTQMKYTRIIITAIIGAFLNYIIRSLPINLGINTFLSTAVLIYLNIKINQIPIKKSISTTLLVVIIEYIAEMINVIGLQLLNLDINKLFQNPINKIIYGLPSLGIFIITVFIIQYVRRRNFTLSVNKNV